jgi:hypothetical protein
MKKLPVSASSNCALSVMLQVWSARKVEIAATIPLVERHLTRRAKLNIGILP